MKKIILIFILSLSLLACSFSSTVLKPTSVESIDYQTLCSYLDDDYTFLLYIARDDCKDCIEFNPYLKSYLESHKDLGVYYLNVKQFRDASRKKNATKAQKKFYQNLTKTLDFDWTPTIEVIVNGQIKKKYQYLDEEYYMIKDKQKKESKKQEFLLSFETFMNEYKNKYIK